nr:uncharacterized protein CTRU02_02214 [Colletotrichum truncatum]KAF6799343.1 hypothetical protein CTRU02_02214 [Colletotrichum truncatum]
MLPSSILAIALFGTSSFAARVFCTDAEHPSDANPHQSLTRSCCGSNSFSSQTKLCDTGSKSTNSFCSCCNGSQTGCVHVG